MGLDVCRLCYGTPVAAIRVQHGADPHGPGSRKTGEYYLLADCSERVTDELRCVRCGKRAAQIHLMDGLTTSPNPGERRISASLIEDRADEPI